MDERKPFMKPSKSFYESFKTYNVRRLLPVTGIPREQFLQEANQMVADAVAMAKASGADAAEQEKTRRYAIRKVAESSLFYFCVVVLNLYFVNNDYGYRLCLDVQYNKWNKLWVIAREHFKDLACDTPILTTKGWKNHGDLVPGDVVFTPKGTSPVVAVRHFTNSHCRQINFRGNNSIVCGNGHLWKAFRYTTSNAVHPLDGKRGVWFESVCETSELMSTSYKHPYIKATGYSIKEDINLPIPPYTLGAWLGDGSSKDGRITKPDDELFEYIKADGFELSHNQYKNTDKHCQTRTVYGLMPMLRKEGLLGNKHIPEIYFRASDRQRLALLQGLMDTDGSMSKTPKNGASFSSSREKLAEDVLALANSLGFKAMMSPIRQHNAYCVTFAVKKSDPYYPFRIARKLANISDRPHQKQAHNWYIQSIDEHETVPTNCIQIADPDGIYLAGKSLIPTHNSTIITEASTLWEIVNDPNQTYCIYSYKVDMAMKFLNVIKGWIENNALLRKLWPEIFWENPALGYEDTPTGRKRWAWTSEQIEVKRSIESKEKTIEVAGVMGSSKTGSHFSRQIFDDTETQKNVETPDAIEKLLQQTLMAFNTGQTDHLEYCFIGTFYARADVYYRMIKEGIFQESVVQPCVDDEGYTIHFSNEKLEEKYRLMGPAVFATQMMDDPSFNSVATFKAEWIRKWNPKPDGLNIYMIVDPASGKTGRKHDYTVILVFGIDAMENMMILDIVRDKIGLEDKFITLSTLYQRYRPIRLYYEQVSMQQDISSLEMLMDKYNTRFPITAFSPLKWGDKESRIEKLRDKFATGQVWIPSNCVHKNFEGRMEDMISTWYMEEYLGFPSIPHDDGLDCMASANLLLTDRELQAPLSDIGKKRTPQKEAEEDVYDPMQYAINWRFNGEEEDYLPYQIG